MAARESVVLAWLESVECQTSGGHSLVVKRVDYAEIVLESKLRGSWLSLIPAVLEKALSDAGLKLTRPTGSTVVERVG